MKTFLEIDMKRTNKLIMGLAIGAGLTAGAMAQAPNAPAGSAAGAVPQMQKDWQAPDISKLPDDKYGQIVRQGKALMEQTYLHIGPEVMDAGKRYAGNNMACVSCHIDVGTRKFGNPWVGTFVGFPQYRGREDAISTTEERINGCLERSMNGRKLPLDSTEMKAMTAYLHFLSTGIAVGAKLEGGGTLKLKPLARAADPVAGKQVYAATCVACHGDKGQGVRRGAVGDANGYLFPPVWGSDSYNNGAGMARVALAAGFIKGNMPSGTNHTNMVLTDEQAFDVAAYINSQPRPVKQNLEVDFPARKNKPLDAAFPPYTPGFSAEQHKYGPWPPIQQAREKGIYPPK
jgi:thiosulfate dehydrogenase